LATFLWYSSVTAPAASGLCTASTGVGSGGEDGGGDDDVGAAGFFGGCDRDGGAERAGVLGDLGGGGDSGGAAGLLMGPSALEPLITANDLRTRCGGATLPTFTLIEGSDGAKDIAGA
jgi:hypothetical protein